MALIKQIGNGSSSAKGAKREAAGDGAGMLRPTFHASNLAPPIPISYSTVRSRLV